MRYVTIPLGLAVALLALACAQNPASSGSPQSPAAPAGGKGYTVGFAFTPVSPLPSSAMVYAVWLEDKAGNNLQNLYVCQKVAKNSLTGTPLPNWNGAKRAQLGSVDAVSGASVQSGFSVGRSLAVGSARVFRVCFEVDRSTNGNDYFVDRPAFTYATDWIDLDRLAPAYPLAVVGWMSNDTAGSPYGQQPTTTIPGFGKYVFMTDLGYIKDKFGSLKDMVEGAAATVVAN